MANAELPISLGLLCSTGKYVSEEKFGVNLNASGVSLRQKQILTICPQNTEGLVAVKTPKGLYMTAKVKGELTADGDSVGSDQEFTVEVQADGAWAFKSSHGYYLSCKNADQLACFARTVEATEKFSIHMAMHPQITVYSPSRRSYVHLAEDELRVNEKLPWGYDAMVTVIFHRANAKYTICASNNKYWNSASKLVDAIDDSCYYVLALVNGKMAFRGNNEKYLSAPTSKNQVWQCTAAAAGANEQFIFEDSHGQVTITTESGKKLSTGKGEPAFNATGVTDKEIYQMEIEDGKWLLRTEADKYVTFPSAFGTGGKGDAARFELTYNNNAVTMSSAGRGVKCASNGAVSGGEPVNVHLDIVNRPQLIIRTEFGFLTAKRAGDVVGCNSGEPEVFLLESTNGNVAFKAHNGKYVSVASDNSLAATSDSAVSFFLEWRVHTKFAIKCSNGNYLKSSQEGKVLATADSAGASLYEY